MYYRYIASTSRSFSKESFMEAAIGVHARRHGPPPMMGPLAARVARGMARRMLRHMVREMLTQMFMQKGRGPHSRHGWGRPADWSRFGGPRGPRFGRGPRAGRGDVRSAILTLLAEKPYNGYQL